MNATSATIAVTHEDAARARRRAGRGPAARRSSRHRRSSRVASISVRISDAEQPEERDRDAEHHAVGPVVDLRADPQPARPAAGPTALSTSERLEREHGARRARRPRAGAARRRLGRRAVVDRRGPRPPADEQAAGVRGVVARHSVDSMARPARRPGRTAPIAAARSTSPARRRHRRSPIAAHRTGRPSAPRGATCATRSRGSSASSARARRRLPAPRAAAPAVGVRHAPARGCSRSASSSDIRATSWPDPRSPRWPRPGAAARAAGAACCAAPGRHKWARVTQRRARRARAAAWQVAPAARADRHADGLVARQALLRLPVSRVTA